MGLCWVEKAEWPFGVLQRQSIVTAEWFSREEAPVPGWHFPLCLGGWLLVANSVGGSAVAVIFGRRVLEMVVRLMISSSSESTDMSRVPMTTGSLQHGESVAA